MGWRSSDEQFCRAEGGASDKPMASANAYGSAHWYLSSFVADVMGSMVCWFRETFNWDNDYFCVGPNCYESSRLCY